MDFLILTIISLGLVIFALFVAQRANLDSIYKRIFWYVVTIFIPFFGPLITIMYCRNVSQKTTVESKMKAVLVNAYSDSKETIRQAEEQ